MMKLGHMASLHAKKTGKSSLYLSNLCVSNNQREKGGNDSCVFPSIQVGHDLTYEQLFIK